MWIRSTLSVVASMSLAACVAPVVQSGQQAAPPTTVESTVPSSTTSVVPDIATPSTTLASIVPVTTVAVPAPVLALTGWEAVDQYLDVTVIPGGSAAVTLAVMRDGVVEHEVSFGGRTSIGDDPVETTDRFRVASISKTITAITALQLVEDGMIGLDDPIGDLVARRVGVGAPAAGVGDITVRELLTHRSGFGQYEDLFFRHQVESCPEAAAVGISRPLSAVPGTTFRYSNLNFCLLGIVIEELTGLSYEDAAYEQLLTPLGIGGMRVAGTFDVGADDVEHVSDVGRNYMEVLGAAGAWIARPSELLAILNSLDPDTPGWKPLNASTLAEMKTITTDPIELDAAVADEASAGSSTSAPPDPEPVVPDTGYGMGLMIFGVGSYGHTGTVESAHAMMVHRSDGITWAITVSGEYPMSTRVLARIVDNALMFGGFVADEYVAAPPPLES